MDCPDQFYLTLPSSASMDLHPHNKVSDYTTELLNNIYLEREDYEVGLCEMLLDVKVENIQSNRFALSILRSVACVQNTLNIVTMDGFNVVHRKGIRYVNEKFLVSRGLYNSIIDVFRHLNEAFKTSAICKDLIFLVHKADKEDSVFVTLRSLLGVNLRDLDTFIFHRYDWFRRSSRESGDPEHGNVINEVELMRSMPTMEEYINRWAEKEISGKSLQFIYESIGLLDEPGMAYVYTDIAEPQYVGNTKAPLLMVVHLVKDQGMIRFPNIHYVPLSKAQLSSIRIYIRDVEGNPYPFTPGVAMCKVHIRKKFQ